MIRGTLVRGTNRLGDDYTCSRCGHEGKFSVTRRRPELCHDCRDLARIDARGLSTQFAHDVHMTSTQHPQAEAETRCDTLQFEQMPVVQTWDNGDISETAPSVTSTPSLAPRYERSTLMKSSANRPVPPLDSRGVA